VLLGFGSADRALADELELAAEQSDGVIGSTAGGVLVKAILEPARGYSENLTKPQWRG